MKPLGKSEFTKIYNGYRKQFTEAIVPNNAQDLPPANPNQQQGQQQQQQQQPNAGQDAAELKEFTSALTNLGAAIGKLKNPAHIENANKALQAMLAKKPQQAKAPVQGGMTPPQQGAQSPAQQAGNNTPLN